MSINPKQQRPLSPHLTIYRPQITSIMSISHRISGVFLSLGTLVLTAWLWAVAYDPEYFAWWSSLFITPLGVLFLGGWSFAFFYHLGNGIRHLFWDMGKGFELANVTFSGLLVLLFAVGMSVLSWVIVAEKLKGGTLS